MQLGDKISALRKGMGLSQEQLADMLGVSRQAISKWETNQSTPDFDNLTQLCNTFCVSADALLGLEEAVTGESSLPITDYIKSNEKKRWLTIGWVTGMSGAILFVIALFILPAVKNAEIVSAIARGSGYYSDPWNYAIRFPMNAVFLFTFGLMIIGLMVCLWSLRKK